MRRHLLGDARSLPSGLRDDARSGRVGDATRGARAHTKAESFLRLLDMLFQIMDPYSTPQTSKFIKYTIVSLAILYFWPSKPVARPAKESK